MSAAERLIWECGHVRARGTVCYVLCVGQDAPLDGALCGHTSACPESRLYSSRHTQHTERYSRDDSSDAVCSYQWGKGGNVTSVGLQVTLCDPIWHVSSRSGEAG